MTTLSPNQEEAAMKFTLTIACDGAAFDPEAGGTTTEEQVALILEAAAERLRDGEDRLAEGIRLMDVNGNSVGWALFEEVDA